jgi:hypothetical protein
MAALAALREGRRLIVSGIFPLTMEPATLLRRLEDDDWV